MSKGSKPAGTITNTNITGEKQEPYLTDLWGQAQRLNNAWFPGATFGTAGDENINFPAWDALAATGRSTSDVLRPQANQTWSGIANNPTGTNSPAYQYWQNLASGNTDPQRALMNIGDTATTRGQKYGDEIAGYAPQAAQYGANAAAGNLGLSQLGQTAQGAFLNSNPYMDKMIQSAMDPVVRNFQTATAPQLDASFAGSGRYGSGAMLGARDTAQQNLGRTLSDMSSNLYGQQYARERQAQDAAAQQYGSLYNSGQQLGMQGAGAAANIYDTAGRQYLSGLNQAVAAQQAALGGMGAGAQGLQSGYQTGTSAATNAASMYPQLAQAQSIGEQQQMEAGKAFNDWQAQYKQEPYKALQMYQGLIGNPIGAGTSQPYFQNQGANTMAGMTGGLDIMSKIGGMASGGWIVCTELMRQNRMPKRYWAVGSCVFARYPKIGQRGYHFWGVPLVRHLRRKPYSLLSRAACAAFNWRAEDLAAKRGVKGARRRLRGRLVTWVLYPICMALGTIVPEQNWQQVYDTDPRTAG